MDKDPGRIPQGLYCYDFNGICPYWSRKSDLPIQENGYCAFLEESDFERNEKIGRVACINPPNTFIEPHEVPMSLIWDQVKECGINDDDEDIV